MSLGAKLKVLVHDSKRQQDQAGSSYIGMDGRRTVQPFITIRVRRERLLEDSLSQISSSIDHLKRALRIEFTNEEGVDAGGLKKEWFLLLCRHLFDARFGMWVQEDESNLCWFNPASFETDEQYTLVGVVVGLAVRSSISALLRSCRAVADVVHTRRAARRSTTRRRSTSPSRRPPSSACSTSLSTLLIWRTCGRRSPRACRTCSTLTATSRRRTAGRSWAR